MSHDPDDEKSKRSSVLVEGKKLLSIYYRHKPGGLCKVLYRSFEAWIAAGGEVHYIATEVFPISNPKIIPHILWTPFRKNEGSLFWVYFILFAPFYAFVIGNRNKIDIVSVHSGFYSFIAGLLKVLLDKPILTFLHCDVGEINAVRHRSPLRIFLENTLSNIGIKLSSRILTVNRALKHRISNENGISKKNIAVLSNSIRERSGHPLLLTVCREKLGLAPDDFVIVTTAVLDIGKNVNVLIGTASFLQRPAVFLIVGDGPEKEKLEQFADGIAGPSRMIFTGWQNDVSIFLGAANLFVTPSKHEGCPLALLEALAYGLPCLGSDIPEIREVLESEELLFDPVDVEALSDKINAAMRDSQYLEKINVLSEKAKGRFVFDWEKRVVSLHADVLSETGIR